MDAIVGKTQQSSTTPPLLAGAAGRSELPGVAAYTAQARIVPRPAVDIAPCIKAYSPGSWGTAIGEMTDRRGGNPRSVGQLADRVASARRVP